MVTPADAAPAADFPAVHLVDLVNRRHQMFPVLTPAEMARLLRFGQRRVWQAGDAIFSAGAACNGMVLLISGAACVSRHDGLGKRVTIVEHGAGEFIADIGQLSGRPSMVDAHAIGLVDALAIAPDALRALLVAEAELGSRIMRALILRRANLIETGDCGPTLIGPAASAPVLALQGFLAANAIPYTLLEADLEESSSALAQAILLQHGAGPRDLPLVLCPGGQVLKNPSLLEMGRCLGLMPELDADVVYDLLVIGAGPAGLAAAVYAASEGLSVMVLEQQSFGGQAGASSRIENYLGFPTGISGTALAGRAFIQAQKFGAEVAVPASVSQLLLDGPSPVALLRDGARVTGRALVIASGVRYRRPALADLPRFEGCGVYYAASPIEARLCRNEDVLLVGGGNSAGQAAVYLARYAATVQMVIRGASLESSMSRYLIERIAATPNITLACATEIDALEADDGGRLQAVVLRDRVDGATRRQPLRHVFMMIGADPNTQWLSACAVKVDAGGFILTGVAAGGDGVANLGTSAPGVFAIGDVRAGSTKRVAAAVGEGAAVVAQVHAFLTPPAAPAVVSSG